MSFAQTLDVDFKGSCGASIVLNENQTLAQSFTSGLSGFLSKVGVGLSINSCTETTVMNCTAKIFEGTCSGTLLTSESFTLSTVASSSVSIREITFSSPADLVSGEVYTIELSVIADQPCNIDPFIGNEPVRASWHGENQFNCGGSYSGGTSFEPGCASYDFDFYNYCSDRLSIL